MHITGGGVLAFGTRGCKRAEPPLESSRMRSHEPELVYWAGNSMPYPLLERAEGAAAAGYAATSCMVADFAPWADAGRTLAELRRELDAREVRLTTVDPYLAWYPSFDPAAPIGVAVEYGAPHLVATEDDVLRWADALGATYVSLVAPFDDPAGTFEDPPSAPFDAVVEALGAFADRVATAGLRPHLEPIPTTKVPDLDSALRLLEAVNRPNLGLLVDTYNLGRAGVVPSDLDAIHHELIFQIQLADAPAEVCGHNYFDDAFFNRRLVGDGDLGAVEMLQRLAAKGPLAPLGPEVFNEDIHGRSPNDAARMSLEATLDVLARLEITETA